MKILAVAAALFFITNCSEDEPFGVEEVISSISISYPLEGFMVSGKSIVSVAVITNSKVDSILYKIENVEEKRFENKKETAAFDFGDRSKYKHGEEYTLVVKWWGGEGTFSDTSLFIVEDNRTVRITSRDGIDLFNSVPTYLPDSTRIIAQSRRTGNMELFSIRIPVIKRVPHDELKIFDSFTREYDLNLSHNPSSEIMPFYWAAKSKLIYSSNREGNYQLYLLDLITEEVDTLTSDKGIASFFPSGSNSGNLLVYERVEEGDSDIWMITMTNTLSAPLLQREGSDGHPSFSPDDAIIIFHSNFNGRFDIWTMPSAGGDPELLVDWDSDEKNPVWSPDGNIIAFTSNRAGNDDVWLYRLSDGSAVQLTSNSADEDFAAFHPSDPEILFSAFIDGNYDIFRLSDIYKSF